MRTPSISVAAFGRIPPSRWSWQAGFCPGRATCAATKPRGSAKPWPGRLGSGNLWVIFMVIWFMSKILKHYLKDVSMCKRQKNSYWTNGQTTAGELLHALPWCSSRFALKELQADVRMLTLRYWLIKISISICMHLVTSCISMYFYILFLHRFSC